CRLLALTFSWILRYDALTSNAIANQIIAAATPGNHLSRACDHKEQTTMRNRLVILFATAALLTGGLASGAPVAAAAQKKVSRPVKKAPVQPQTVFAQGYQKAYADGFAAGQADWSRGVPNDFRRSDAYQRRDQSFAPKFAAS